MCEDLRVHHTSGSAALGAEMLRVGGVAGAGGRYLQPPASLVFSHSGAVSALVQKLRASRLRGQHAHLPALIRLLGMET